MSIPHASKSNTTTLVGRNLVAFTLRWYMRVVGVVLLGYVCYLLWGNHASSGENVLKAGSLIVLSGAAITGSFGVKEKHMRGFISFFIALFGGLVLFSDAMSQGLIAIFINDGLDPQRAQLVAALMLTAATALLGAALGRRKLGACVGSGIMFWFGYLASFIQLELQPARDPGGNLEPLNSGALAHTSLILLALAFLSAFIGAAVGCALGEVLLAPPYRLARLIWQRFAHAYEDHVLPNNGAAADQLPRPRTVVDRVDVVGSWLIAATMIIFLVLASSSGGLFIFAPDVGLHTVPTVPTGGGQHMPAHGTIAHESIISAALSGQSKPFLVYLPPSYNTPQAHNKRYPTLYLLHGSPGSDHDWFTAGKADQSADTLIALGKIPELILILPDGNGTSGAPSEWGNSLVQQQFIETYLAVDLVKYVDQKYRTLAQASDRAIGGLSMGGFGAMNIAVHHPAVFGSVISLGGYFHAEGSIWGNNAAYIQENSPAAILPTAKAAWKLHLFLEAASKDEPYYTDSIHFARELDSLSMPYRLDIQPGYHAWNVWQVQLYHALLWLHWD